jgi:hypothetical protein
MTIFPLNPNLNPRGAAGAGLRLRLRLRLRKKAAFTLIEIIISSSLMAMILVSSYLCLSAALSSQKQIEPRLTVIQNARVAMALITADIRAACPLSKECEFLGTDRMLGDIEADSLDFATHNYTPRRDNEGDFCEVTYFLARDPRTSEYVLYRRRNALIGFNPFSGGKNEEIARGLLGLRFEYFDGLDWYNSWGEITRPDKPKTSLRIQPNLSGMPVAVRLTLWFDADPKRRPNAVKNEGAPQPAQNDDVSAEQNTKPETATIKEPFVFQTLVPLELAGAPQRASSGDNSAGDSNGQQPQQTPDLQNLNFNGGQQ